MPRGKKKNAQKGALPKKTKKQSMPKAQKRKSKARKASTNMVRDITPAAYNGRGSVKPFFQRSVRLKGCELLTTIAITSGAVSTGTSAIIGSADLNPLLLAAGGRLSQFAELFDKYQYNSIKVHYIPSVSVSTSGGLLFAADPDVLDDYSGQTGDPLVQALVNTAHNVETPVYQDVSMVVKDKRFFSQLLYTDPDVSTIEGKRWSSPGKIWWANMGPLGAATAYGRIMVEWDITFSEPSNDSENSAGVALIGTSVGTAISSTYPWGDFSTIRNGFALGSAYYLNTKPFCSFYSDPVKGSVIRFNAAGYYFVAMSRTGSAMGTGAYTSVVYTNCTNGWPANQTNLAAYTPAISNGASSVSMWNVIVYASQPGATMSATGDSGVTHASGYVFVSRVNLVAQTNGGFGAVQNQLDEIVQALKKNGISLKSFLPGDPSLNFTQTSTTTVHDPAGGPDIVSQTVSTGAATNGPEPVNVITPGAAFRLPAGYVMVQK